MSDPVREDIAKWQPWVLGTVVAIVGFALPLVGLDRSPVPWSDEIFYAEPARTLAATGKLVAPMFAGVRGLDQAFYLQPPVSILERALVFRLFGFDRWQVRLSGAVEYALVGVLAFALVWSLARATRLRPWLALAAAWFVLADPSIGVMSRSGRPDFVPLILVFASMLTLVHAPRRPDGDVSSPWLAATGLLEGLAVLAHTAMAFSVPGSALAALLSSRRRPLRGVAAWATGAVVPVILWALFVMPHAQLWTEQFLPHLRGYSQVAGASHWWLNGPAHLLRLLSMMWLTPLAYLVFPLLALAGRLTGRARIPALYAVSQLVLGLLSPSFYGSVLVLMYPVALLVLDALLAAPPRWLTMRRVRVALVLAALSFAVWPVCRVITAAMMWHAQDPKPVAQLVEQVPSGEPIVGVPEAYYEIATARHAYYQATPFAHIHIEPTREDQRTFQSTLNRSQPRYFVLGRDMDPEQLFSFLGPSRFVKRAAYHTDAPRSPLLQAVSLRSSQTATYDLVLWERESAATDRRR